MNESSNSIPGMCTGLRQGRVVSPPQAPGGEQAMDGVLVFSEGQASLNCSFGAFQVSLQVHTMHGAAPGLSHACHMYRSGTAADGV